ncbi:MAG: hypothetical protein SPI92_06385, partial [Alloprevotella sp.]|nr:hypothetical protein [Alloprevotella sp.]
MRISAIAQKLRFRCHVNGHGPTKLRPGGMSIDVALSTRRGVGRDTYSLPQNAAAPRVARQWVRPRSSAMSIDVALSTRRGVGRDTYSLP